MKDKDFILKVTGLFLLAGLTVMFAVLEYRSGGKEIIDVGILIGIIGSIVGNHAYVALKGSKNNEQT